MEEKYDSPLLGILQSEGKVENFLNVMLGFLYRRTDFYRLMKSKEDRLGFPPGVALRMLTGIFKQYDDLTRRDDQMREAKKEEEVKRRKKQEEAAKSKVETKSNGEHSETSRANEKYAGDKQNKSCDKQPRKAESGRETETRSSTESKTKSMANAQQIGENSQVKSDKEIDTAKSEKVVAAKEKHPQSEDDKEDPELERQQKAFQSNPESYNGAVRDNYTWSQSITDLDLRVKVPTYIRKGKDLKVQVDKKHIKVSHKDEAGQFKVVVDGDLTWEVQKDESIWTLNPGENVHINCEKKEERWWEAMFTDEPKISVRKIDASRPMSDLDQEAQAKIEEMMYNDRQKKLGLPQSHEQKVHDMLKNAWDAEGSPFQGQPFDPSKFTVDPGGVVNMKPN